MCCKEVARHYYLGHSHLHSLHSVLPPQSGQQLHALFSRNFYHLQVGCKNLLLRGISRLNEHRIASRRVQFRSTKTCFFASLSCVSLMTDWKSQMRIILSQNVYHQLMKEDILMNEENNDENIIYKLSTGYYI